MAPILMGEPNHPPEGLLTDTNFPATIDILNNETMSQSYEADARPFARGKFAQVRRCRHKESGKEYAAKVMRKRRRASDVRHEIMHEVRVLLMAAQNDRIVNLHQVFETPTEVILMLEMVEGGELQRVLDEEEAIPERDTIRIIKQIIEAVAFLHQNNIAHLDIKPQNVLLTKPYPHGDVKLCDFSISRLIIEGSELREIVGTPDYVAPEILHYEPISLATDMWSLGVLTYVLLSGFSPFGAETKQETYYNITNGRLDFPLNMFDSVSETAKDFIRRLLVKDPKKRMSYKDCLEHEWLNSMEKITKALPANITSEIVRNSFTILSLQQFS